MTPVTNDHVQRAAALNPWAAAVTVLWAPEPVFHLVCERAPILPVYLVQTVMGVLYQLAFAPLWFAEESGGAFVLIWGMLLPWLSGLGMAVCLWLFGLLLRSGHRLSFRQYFAAAGYVRMAGVISAILAMPVLIRSLGTEKAPHDIDAVMSAVLFATSASPATTAFLRLTAPLVIWEYVLVAVALAVLHRTDLKRSAWVAALLWALSSLIRIGWYWTAT